MLFSNQWVYVELLDQIPQIDQFHEHEVTVQDEFEIVPDYYTQHARLVAPLDISLIFKVTF